jgi:hypothetical protein
MIGGADIPRSTEVPGNPELPPREPERGIGVPLALYVAALTLLKLVLAAQAELSANESYHWLFARHLALSYYNHPGMVGWVVWLSTRLFGESPLGVRVLPIFLGSLSVVFSTLAVRRLYGPREARWTALLVGLVWEFLYLGSTAYPESPLLFFWSLTLWALARALEGGSWRAWLLAGASLGLAFESKYVAAFLGVGVFLFLALSPEHRPWLRRPEPYLAALLSMVCFTPTLLWNAQHDWVSLRYQGLSRFSEGPGEGAGALRTFPLSELVHLTPVVAISAWAVGLRVLFRFRSSPWQDRLLALVGMPWLLFLLGLAFFRRIAPHWTVAGHLSLVLLLGSVLPRSPRWIRLLHGGTLGLLALGYLLLPFVLALLPAPWLDRWSQVARGVRERAPDFVISPSYHAASQLAYQLRPLPVTDLSAAGRGQVFFQSFFSPGDWVGKDAVIVLGEGDARSGLELLRPHFERLEPPEEIRVTRSRGKIETFVLVRARRYRG